MGLLHALGNSLSVMRHYLWYKRAEFFDADLLEAVQRERLETMFRTALKTKHYGKAFEGLSIRASELLDNLDALPLTTKDSLRNNEEAFLQPGIDTKSLVMTRTSGSTGTPTHIYMSKESENYRYGLRYATDVAFGRSPFELFARLHSINYEKNPLLRRSGLFPMIFLPVFAPEEENYAALRAHRPRVMRGYPSSMLMLARLNSASDNQITFKSLISNAEILSEKSRKAIEESFSCPVYNHYGTVEASSIARDCPDEKNLHVDSFSCIVEIVGNNGKPKKSGEGEIAITPLWNPVMPLFRFRTGDRGSWGECSCGRSTPVLKSMSGRLNDLIVMPSGRLRPSMSFDPLADLSPLYAYQLVQEEPDLFVFRYVPLKGDISYYLKKEIMDGIVEASLGEKVRVEFEAVNSIRKEKGGKLRSIISKVPPPHLP